MVARAPLTTKPPQSVRLASPNSRRLQCCEGTKVTSTAPTRTVCHQPSSAQRRPWAARSLLTPRPAWTGTESRLRLESGRSNVRYPLQKFQDQGLVVPAGAGTYRTTLPLETAVRYYEEMLRIPPRTGSRPEAAPVATPS